mgnify:CR=1 FL=1
MIPIFNPHAQYEALREEIDAAIRGVCQSGQYILGPNVKAFEREAAAYLGCDFAVGVGSGSDALHLALRALEIGPGDEVITTPCTFVATTEAIGLVGAKPVFVDIDPETLHLDLEQAESEITPPTQPIRPVHLYGQPCDMDPLMELARSYGLRVVEDCAQSMGAQYHGQATGTFGDLGCFSFFPTKNLGGLGDGGLVVTSDPELLERVEMLRRHGSKVKCHQTHLGLNSRLDELQAAVLRVKLPHLDSWCAARRAHACRYNELFQDMAAIRRPRERGAAGLVVPRTPEEHPLHGIRAVYHHYAVQVAERDAVMRSLQAAGIGCGVYYPVAMHLQAVHASLNYRPGSLPHAEAFVARHLCLPVFPELTAEQQERVARALRDAVNRHALPLRRAA